MNLFPYLLLYVSCIPIACNVITTQGPDTGQIKKKKEEKKRKKKESVGGFYRGARREREAVRT